MIRQEKYKAESLSGKNLLSASSQEKSAIFNYKKFVKPSLTQEDVKQIKDIFDIFDPEVKGVINPKELVNALNSVDFKMKEDTLYQQFMNLVAEGEGSIQFQKFLILLTTKVTESDSHEEMLQLFSLLDDQKCGFITIKNLRRAVRETGILIEEQQLQKMIEVADANRDGKVNEEDFYGLMTGRE